MSKLSLLTRLITISCLLSVAACRKADDAEYVRLAGNVFIFNYREAVATYVISLQRLRAIPEGAIWVATFENPAGGAPQVVKRRIYPSSSFIAVESDPVFCIVAGREYSYKIEIMSGNTELQWIEGKIKSSISQDILPDKPLVIGPGYDKNLESFRIESNTLNKSTSNLCKN